MFTDDFISTLTKQVAEALRPVIRQEIAGHLHSIPKADTGKRSTLTIEEACTVTGLAKSTIYALAPKGKIPSYRKGKRLYFFEDELLQWIQSGKRLSQAEIDDRADQSLQNKKSRA